MLGIPVLLPYNEAMSLRNFHPDLKLALVLVAAAALLELGDSRSHVATVGVMRFDRPPLAWLVVQSGLGFLALLFVAIWVDRRPPHTVMAAGALLGVLGLTIAGVHTSLVAYVLGTLIVGVGASTVHLLVFYAIAAKGATRHRGALIGALGAISALSLNVDDVLYWPVRYWPIDETWLFIAASAAFTLAGAALIFALLPRVFSGANGSNKTLRAKSTMPGLWKALVWATLVFSVALAIITSTSLYFPNQTMRATSGHEGLVLQLLSVPVFTAAGVLLWGIARYAFNVRLLLLLTALLLLLGAGAYLVPGGLPADAVGSLAIRLALGGLICLPWILMTELLSVRHFAKLALLISLVGALLGALLNGLAITIAGEGDDFFPVVILMEGVTLAIVAILLPKPRAAEERRQINSPA